MATEWISTRTVLWYVTFFGFAANYMVRININIAIIGMVRPRISHPGQIESECFSANQDNFNITSSSNSTTFIQDGFPWDEREQGLILGAFYWLNWLTQLPGGMLAQRFGGKSAVGLSQLAGILLCFLMPAASYYDLKALLFLRIIQGAVAGFLWPAMSSITGVWIPPNERSKFVTAYLGGSIGAALTYPLCGLLIDWFGWESVFHVTGFLGVLWFLAWWTLVYDTPADHPRISDEERNYIQKSLGQTLKKPKLKTPWKQLLLSKPLWLNIIVQWGGVWGLFTILVQSPTYFKLIHGWDVRSAGFLSGLPNLARMTVGYVFSSFGDYLLRNKKMTRTNVRKLATAVCNVGQGIMTVMLAFVGCNSTAAIILVTVATGLHGAVSTGPMSSIVDISPNFAGISQGLCGMISAIPGFISPAIVGALTLNNQTVGQWQIVFLISAGLLLSSGVLYILFGESEVQSWNSPPEEKEATELLEIEKKTPSKNESTVNVSS